MKLSSFVCPECGAKVFRIKGADKHHCPSCEATYPGKRKRQRSIPHPAKEATSIAQRYGELRRILKYFVRQMSRYPEYRPPLASLLESTRYIRRQPNQYRPPTVYELQAFIGKQRQHRKGKHFVEIRNFRMGVDGIFLELYTPEAASEGVSARKFWHTYVDILGDRVW